MFKLLQCIVPALVALSYPVVAQTQSTVVQGGAQFSRIGKHNIELSVGLLSKLSSGNRVALGNITIESKGVGVMGSVSYSYWLEENLAVGVSGGLLSADANTAVTGAAITTETAAVIPVLFGVKYQPFTMTGNNTLRPVVSVAIGPYIGAASNTRTGLTTAAESYTETAIGGRVAAGIDLALANWLTLGVGAGYHAVTDFAKRVGSEKNYSGPEFALAVGVLF